MMNKKTKCLSIGKNQKGVAFLEAMLTLVLGSIFASGVAISLIDIQKNLRDAKIQNLMMKAVRADINKYGGGGMTANCGVNGAVAVTDKVFNLKNAVSTDMNGSVNSSVNGSTSSYSSSNKNLESVVLDGIKKKCTYETTSIEVDGFSPVSITVPAVGYEIESNLIKGKYIIGKDFSNVQ